MGYSNLFVVLMGMGTVFFGLICIVVLIWAMGKVLGNVTTASGAAAPAELPRKPAERPAAPSVTPEIIAAITCALAHELDARPSGLSILSIKKL